MLHFFVLTFNTYVNIMINKIYLTICLSIVYLFTFSQSSTGLLLKPERVFDGQNMHSNWWVWVDSGRIKAAGPAASFSFPKTVSVIEFPGKTLMPGMIEGHGHLFLHPYNETPWDDQVLKESRAERTARAVNHARETLLAGFTTLRDLGTEGAMYDDAGLKQAIEKGIIPGPRLIIATRAIVATGSYGPANSPDLVLPKGASEADGREGIAREVRVQIGMGADFIKVYADYRWGQNQEARPTFTEEEIRTAVEVAGSSGRPVVAHAATAEGMRRAIMAGVSTIEHGDGATPEIYRLMKEKGIALYPTLAAGEAILQYRGWVKGKDREPPGITEKKLSFRQALEAGVTICMGGDVGVYTHGDNAREMELMKEYGMTEIAVLRSVTSVNASIFGIKNKVGSIKSGLLADLIIVEGDPSKDISLVRKVTAVMKGGVWYKK
jgi:imidazolonepropionase-like amidohydrolase